MNAGVSVDTVRRKRRLCIYCQMHMVKGVRLSSTAPASMYSLEWPCNLQGLLVPGYLYTAVFVSEASHDTRIAFDINIASSCLER